MFNFGHDFFQWLACSNFICTMETMQTMSSVEEELIEDICQHSANSALLRTAHTPPNDQPLASAWTQWLQQSMSGGNCILLEKESAQSFQVFFEHFYVHSESVFMEQPQYQSMHVFKQGQPPQYNPSSLIGILKMQAHSLKDAKEMWPYLATKMVLEKLPRYTLSHRSTL